MSTGLGVRATTFVGLNEQDVPFEGWSCPGAHADTHGDRVAYYAMTLAPPG